jgi:lipopolysaccharide biosynthesis glycosyltransferase
MKVYIGYDSSEPEAYDVAEASLRGRSSIPVEVTRLDLVRLAEMGLLRRPRDTRGGRYDILSNAPASTDFAISRFLVPLLAQSGWALFVDSDVAFLGDIAELLTLADPRYAVMCVQHAYTPGTAQKMDGQVQTAYARKNWSSVMLFNCDHPANRRLSLVDVQERRGFDLHQFYWLNDAEIGALPAEWNWLVGEQERPANPKIAHFTLGGPFTRGWRGGDFDSLWYEEQRRWLNQNSALEPDSNRSSTSSHAVAA